MANISAYQQMIDWYNAYAARTGKAPSKEIWAQAFSQLTGAPIDQGLQMYDWGRQYIDTMGQPAPENVWTQWQSKIAPDSVPKTGSQDSPYQQMISWYKDYAQRNGGQGPSRDEWAQRFSQITGATLDEGLAMYDRGRQYQTISGGAAPTEDEWNSWVDKIAPGTKTPTLAREELEWRKQQAEEQRRLDEAKFAEDTRRYGLDYAERQRQFNQSQQQGSEQYWAGLLASQTGPRDWLRYQITQSKIPQSALERGNLSVMDIANNMPAFGASTPDPGNAWEDIWRNWQGPNMGGNAPGNGSGGLPPTNDPDRPALGPPDSGRGGPIMPPGSKPSGPPIPRGDEPPGGGYGSTPPQIKPPAGGGGPMPPMPTGGGSLEQYGPYNPARYDRITQGGQRPPQGPPMQRSPEQYAIDQAYNDAYTKAQQAATGYSDDMFRSAPQGWQPGQPVNYQPRTPQPMQPGTNPNDLISWQDQQNRLIGPPRNGWQLPPKQDGYPPNGPGIPPRPRPDDMVSPPRTGTGPGAPPPSGPATEPWYYQMGLMDRNQSITPNVRPQQPPMQRSPEQYAIDQAYNKARSDYARANGEYMTDDFQSAPPGWQPGMGYTPRPQQPQQGPPRSDPNREPGQYQSILPYRPQQQYLSQRQERPPWQDKTTWGGTGGPIQGPPPTQSSFGQVPGMTQGGRPPWQDKTTWGGTGGPIQGPPPNTRPKNYYSSFTGVSQPINYSPREYGKMSPTLRSMQEGEWQNAGLDANDQWAKMKNAWATGSGQGMSTKARWR